MESKKDVQSKISKSPFSLKEVIFITSPELMWKVSAIEYSLSKLMLMATDVVFLTNPLYCVELVLQLAKTKASNAVTRLTDKFIANNVWTKGK